ncbi:MAG: PD40 domain-containing protein [Bryobacterales bacterium]|nr:PD40 domain-containing protein [Bryobacterales bacterium]
MTSSNSNPQRLASILILPVLFALCGCQARWTEHAQRVSRPPVLYPDYGGTVIAPNIAPLNFAVKEPGVRFLARMAGEKGGAIEVSSRNGKIAWPARGWKQLLARNRGAAVRATITVQDKNGVSRRFDEVRIGVSQEELDRYVVYRLIPPLDHYYVNIGVYQRDLEGFSERPVIENQNFAIGRNGCVNCHSFRRNRPDRMSLQIRSTNFGKPMVVVKDGEPRTVDTSASGFSKSPAAYQHWHPEGRYVAYTVNTVMPLEHTVGEHRDAWDEDSDLAVYDTEANQVLTTRGIADPERRENWPSWSADGRTLYFVSAPQLPWTQLQEVKYDLMRISFDPATGTWGERETILSAADSGRSAAQPKESPDGRWLLFLLAHHGNFPTYQPICDLYVIDLRNGTRHPLNAVNRRWSGSWPTWSSNGRWICFTSKREGGVLGRIYFSYFDRNGEAHRPFVMPQKDPSFYESCTMTFNLPELIIAPVPLSPSRLGRAITAQASLPAPSLVRK